MGADGERPVVTQLPAHPIVRQRQLFLGKYCTILLPGSAFPMTPQDAAITFVGKVVEISDMGIVIQYPNGNHALFYWDKVMGIVENEVTSREDFSQWTVGGGNKQKKPTEQAEQKLTEKTLQTESSEVT